MSSGVVHATRIAWRCKHILRICNTHCFSTATIVTRTRLNIALHVCCSFCMCKYGRHAVVICNTSSFVATYVELNTFHITGRYWFVSGCVSYKASTVCNKGLTSFALWINVVGITVTILLASGSTQHYVAAVGMAWSLLCSLRKDQGELYLKHLLFREYIHSSMLCWPCITVYRYNETCITVYQYNETCITVYQYNETCITVYQYNETCITVNQYNETCITIYQYNETCITLYQYNETCITVYQYKETIVTHFYSIY
jgi:hypothetical protein